ncbi:AI-2E family transporter [Roseomonas sp. NAR14]|uniref:AI-2E family transporter n=1 Tax=Roseomonas acroporae TaxID=2937791 RepID=A0A9X2BY73_9PROT|nr:AI-2E family transporter [Roseomonas acroporae]MCK8786689.1 AI-2E family transporter [Roseomonas acroporae]
MMPFDPQRQAGTSATQPVNPPGLATLYGAAIVIAGVYFGRELFVPLVLAVLLAFVLAPAVRLLRRLRLGQVPSVVLVVLLAFSVILGIGTVVGHQVTQLVGNLPRYQATIQEKVHSLRVGGEMVERVNAAMRDFGAEIAGGGRGAAPSQRLPAPVGDAEAQPARQDAAPSGEPAPLGVVRALLEPLLAPIATAGIVVVFVIFALLYREDLRDRVVRLAGSRDLHRTITAMDDAAYRLSRFFLTQLALNTGFGVFIAAALWVAGLPNPVLWGILAALMRFVPFVGTFIAVVPPVMLALAVAPGWGLAITVAALFVVSEAAMGQVVEPLLYGHSTGLSPVSVVLSATFWTFIWGPIGLLLATPLTVCLVVLGRHVEPLRFLDVMLGDRPPLAPEESFYQRALTGDADGMVEQARHYLKTEPLAAYYDTIALRGLVLAQGDLSREVLEPERQEEIHRQVLILVDELAHSRASPVAGGTAAGAAGAQQAAAGDAAGVQAGAQTGAAPAMAWREDGAVLFVAGRGQFDDLAAAMAAQPLQRLGFGTRVEPNAVLGETQLGQLDPARIRLCCLSVLEEGNTAAGVRYFLRRVRRQLPDAAVMIGLWHGTPDGPMLQALRAEGLAETIVTSLREAVAYCQAAAQAEPGPAAEPAPRPAERAAEAVAVPPPDMLPGASLAG